MLNLLSIFFYKYNNNSTKIIHKNRSYDLRNIINNSISIIYKILIKKKKIILQNENYFNYFLN